MRKPSRGPTLDRQECIKQAGGNQFNLVLLAAALSRKMIDEGGEVTNTDAPMTALLAIQNGDLAK